MGNALSPCLGGQQQTHSSSSTIKIVFWEGPTRILTGKKHIAGEIMFEFPDKMVCHGDSFFIGHPLPALSIDDDLMPGQTYFVLPVDRFSCHILTVATLAVLSGAGDKPGPLSFGNCPFEYVKGENGRALIKVTPEFIERILSKGKEESGDGGGGFLCSTPELKKHYEQLVGCKEQVWSPRLETISEYKIRFSPCRLLGLEWKQKESGY